MPDYFETGFMVREPAWHGMGVVLDDYPGRAVAQVLAGHNFKIVEQPLYIPTGQIAAASIEDLSLSAMASDPTRPGLAVTEDGVLSLRHATDYKGLVKRVLPVTAEDMALVQPYIDAGYEVDLVLPGDASDGRLVHVSSDSYGTVQNGVGWDIIDQLVGEGVKYETAGVLKGGAVCWVLAFLDEPHTVPGDDSVILPYLNVSWSHDGSTAIKARPTSIRVVCWNTQSAAEAQGQRNANEYTFRHTKNVMEKIEDAELTMEGMRVQHQAFIDFARDLCDVPITRDQRELFITQLVPMPPEALISERVKGNIEDQRSMIRLLFRDEEQTSIPEAHRLTGYGMWLAGTEFLDHLRGYRSRDTLFGRQLLRNEPMKGKLRGLIEEVAKA